MSVSSLWPKIIDHCLSLYPEIFLSDDMIEQVCDFEEECLDAYFHESEDVRKNSPDERIRLVTERYSSARCVTSYLIFSSKSCDIRFFPLTEAMSYLILAIKGFCRSTKR